MIPEIPEQVLSPVIEKLVDTGFHAIRDFIGIDRRITLKSNAARMKRALADHRVIVESWASEIPSVSPGSSYPIDQAFVDLDLSFDHLRGKMRRSQALRTSELATVSDHCVILGEPGAGKTTTLKRICRDRLQARAAASKSTPLIVRLRELQSTGRLVDALLEILGVDAERHPERDPECETKPHEVQRRVESLVNGIVCRTLDSIHAFVLIDGLDEVHPEILKSVVQDLQTLVLGVKQAQVVITCRTSAFIYQLEGLQCLEICPLSEGQIRQFTIRYLGRESAPRFLDVLQAAPYHGSEIRPLLLGMLCVLFQRTGSIPNTPRSIYRALIDLLLTQWDQQRLVHRQSRYEDFVPNRKHEFLARLAYELTITTRAFEFSLDTLECAYRTICRDFGLPIREAREVIREIQSHTGLIVSAGYERYTFVHKSFQEFFCADYISRLPIIPDPGVLQFVPNECAIALALSGDASVYFDVVVVQARKMRSRYTFIPQFLDRVLAERPDFRANPLLGLAYFDLLSFVREELPSIEELVDEKLGKIAEHPNARAAIRSFLNLFQPRPSRRDGYWDVPIDLDLEEDEASVLGWRPPLHRIEKLPRVLTVPETLLR